MKCKHQGPPFALAATLLLLITGCATRKEDPGGIPGGMAHHFAMQLAYAPKSSTDEARFVITLKNISAKDLEVEVGRKSFHGSIFIESTSSGLKEYCPQEYRNLRLTSQWGYPITVFKSGSTISWEVPVSDLRYVDSEGSIPDSDLRGYTAFAKLEMLTVFGSKHVITNNGRQITPKIKL